MSFIVFSSGFFSLVLASVVEIAFPQEFNTLHHSDFQQQIFLKEDHYYLNVPRVGTLVVYDIFKCAFKCISNPSCFSLNLAASKDADGKIWCELLSSDKHRIPENYSRNSSSHHLFIKNECLSFPCQNKGKCVPNYKWRKFKCYCTDGFKGDYCEIAVQKSCKDFYDKHRSNVSIIVTLDLGTQLIPILCHMGDLGCGDGGWTPVIKINGNKTTFHYDSDLWSNHETFNVAGGVTGFDSQETKLPTYWKTRFSTICLGMKIGHQIRFIKINKTANSLMSLIADSQYRGTSLGRRTWKELIGSKASLQRHCNKEGFNVVGSSFQWSRARIGILANNENACSNCDSRIGFGTGGYHDNSSTCGNEASLSADRGDKHIKAMGFILVQ